MSFFDAIFGKGKEPFRVPIKECRNCTYFRPQERLYGFCAKHNTKLVVNLAPSCPDYMAVGEVQTQIDENMVVSLIPLRMRKRPFYIGYPDGSTIYVVDVNGDEVDSGLNASAVIQNAMNSLTNIKGTLMLVGSFDISSQIVHKANVLFGGLFPFGAILNSQITDGSSVIKTDSADDSKSIAGIELQDLQIKGNGSEGHGVEWIFAPRTRLQNVIVDGVGGSGFHIHHCWGGKAFNLKADNCLDGIELQDRNHAFDLLSCHTNNNSRYSIYIHEDGQGAGANIKVLGGFHQNGAVNDILVDDARGIEISTYCENAHAGIDIIELKGTSIGVTLKTCLLHGNDVASLVKITEAYDVRLHENRFLGTGSETAIAFVAGDKISEYDNRFEGIATEFSGSPTSLYRRAINKLNAPFSVGNQDLTSVWKFYTASSTPMRFFTRNASAEDIERLYIGYGDLPVFNLKNILFGIPALSSDPSTTGWGANQKGEAWFNTTENVIKYWDGSAIKSLYARAPDYDSGWFSIAASDTETKTHGLNTLNTMVYGEYSASSNGNQAAPMGGSMFWWNKTATQIMVSNDFGDSKYARIVMWKLD